MALFAYLNGSDTAKTRIRLRSGGEQGIQGLTSAADGTGSLGGIIFEDPSADLTVTGWMPITVEEADCPNRRLFTGYVGNRTYRRGHYRVSAGREIDTEIVDQNTLLSLRLITGSDANRPAETDTARLAWLLGSAYLSGLVYDTGKVNGAGRSFDAANYHGQYPADVLADLVAPRGQIFFAFWDHSANKVGLFYDAPTATTYTSTLSISNDLADISVDANGDPTGTVIYPYIDGELTSDPSDIYSNIRYVYAGGVIYDNLQSTADTFFPSPLLKRGINVENTRVGKASTARTFAQRILARDAAERVEITCTIRLPASKVGLIDAGMRLFVKFTHLPGFTSSTATRVERRTIVQTEGDNTHYDMNLTLSMFGATIGGGSGPSGGNSPGTFPYQPPSTTHLYSGHIEYMTEGGGSSAGAAATIPHPVNTTTLVTGSTSVTLTLGTTYNYHFLHTLNTLDLLTSHQVGLNDGSTWNTPHIVTSAGDSTVLYEGSFTCVSANAGTHGVSVDAPGASHVSKAAALDWWIDDPTTGSTNDEAPLTGQVIENETPTPASGGGRKTFTTAYAFGAGSIRVYVDDIDHTNDITSSDGANRTFTLGFDPRSYEVVTVTYLVLA